MTATLQQRLERIARHRTKYEVVATSPDGRRVLLGYTPRKGRQGLCDLISSRRERAEAIVRLCGSEEYRTAKAARDGATCGEWKINFSGRTQRECYLGGELPYVESL